MEIGADLHQVICSVFLALRCPHPQVSHVKLSSLKIPRLPLCNHVAYAYSYASLQLVYAALLMEHVHN